MDEKLYLGAGLKFPPQVNKATGRFVLSSKEESVKESIYLILMTQKTERFMRPEYGSSILSYAFADTGETMIVMMEDALMYTRKLDVGGLAIVGADGLLYAPGTVMSMEEVLEVPVDFEKQAAWMENYWDAVDELEDME